MISYLINLLRKNGIVIFIFLLSILLRLYRLDQIPGEMWGDVIEHYKYANEILHGNFFFDYRFGGDGPLFSYIVAFLFNFIDPSFYTLKLITVFIGAAFTAVVFFLAKELFGKKEIAYISSFLTAVSFWSLSFSRQAKSHILVPLFVSLAILFVLKKQHILSGLSFGLGMWAQAGIWGIPLVFLSRIKTLIIGLFLALPIIFSFIKTSDISFSANSFFVEKMGFSSGLSILDFFARMAHNLVRNLFSFNAIGDPTFRHNIAGKPHLDNISGLFFLAGFILIGKKIVEEKDKKLLFYFIIPFFALQIPSILDVNNPLSTPNMGRTIGILPFAYMGAAYGIYGISYYIKAVLNKRLLASLLVNLLIFLLLGAIAGINLFNYFVIYPKGLPNGNTPFGKIIAEKIDTYPMTTSVAVVGCCWGEWGQPEPNGIRFTLKYPRNLYFFEADDDVLGMFSCSKIRNLHKKNYFVLIINPSNDKVIQEATSCLTEKISLLKRGTWNIAKIVEGKVISTK